jgi:hypothetical protein
MSDKVKLTVRALEARAKRYALTKDNEILRKCKADSRWYPDMGDYYFVDASTNAVSARGWNLHNLIEWCSEEGILKPFEEVLID